MKQAAHADLPIGSAATWPTSGRIRGMALDFVTSSEECAVCTNGLLAFMVFDDGGWFLECQECLTGYLGLHTTGSQFRCEDLADYRPATRQEVDCALGR